MESLGDILRRVTARNTWKPTNGDGARILIDQTEADVCPDCRGSGWVRKDVPIGHPDFGEAFPCHCRETDNPISRVASLRKYSNLGPLSRITFAATKLEGPLPDAISQGMFAQALEAVVRFAENPEGWLTLAGPHGSGKTHLAAAAANRCIERGQPTFFIPVADLLDHLRSAYSPNNEVSFDDLFEQVRNVPVLVLDDLSAHSTTPWAQEKLFQVFNSRFNACLPTVVTVRGPLQRLDEGLRSRLESPDGLSGMSCRVLHLGRYNTRLARGIGELPPAMRGRMTFDRFDTSGRWDAQPIDRASLQEVKTHAQKFAADPAGWLVFTGQRGCGKTHLVVAIGDESLRQGRPVFYSFVPSLLDHLRATFSPESPIGYDELFEQIKTVPLLILDDLGAEASTPWAEEKLYQIVVDRIEARLPTVITTVLSIEELEDSKPRLGSRLVETDVVDWHPITAGNYRDQRPGGRRSPPTKRSSS